MSNSDYSIENCIVLSQYPEDQKELFNEKSYYQSLSQKVKNGFQFKNSIRKLPFEHYGLLVEDEIGNILTFIGKMLELEEIRHWIVCKDIVAAHGFISNAFVAPMIVGLDFDLEKYPTSETEKIYTLIKENWIQTPVFGITQFENSRDLDHVALKNKMRSSGDSVYLKGETGDALPNIVRDKLAITFLQEKLRSSQRENKRLNSELNKYQDALPKTSGKPYLVGDSKPMRLVYNELLKLKSVDDIRVLILGAPGTGKELVAKAIHEDSPRGKSKTVPFLAINCSEISSETGAAISKLFGHKKNSFTDAKEDKQGIFEIANNGTIFLDEIGELAPDAQTKLLRFLVDGCYTRYGEDEKTRKSNVRIISATNADLQEKINTGAFRDDFFSRVGERIIKLPSLDDRTEDIPVLAAFFINDADLLVRKFGNDKIKFEFEKGLFESISGYHFSANVRQLRNSVINAMIEAKFESQPDVDSVFISRQHFYAGLMQAGVKQKEVININDRYSDDCSETEEFLDKIEKIIKEHFADAGNVTQDEFLPFFASTRSGIVNIKRQTFTNLELNPRKFCIELLLKRFPDKWPDARLKCKFIRNAKV